MYTRLIVAKKVDPVIENSNFELDKLTLPERADKLKKAVANERKDTVKQQKPFVPWSVSNKIIKEFSVNPSDTSWMKLIVAENNITHKKYLRLRRFRQNFNIHSPEYLANITKAAYEGAKLIGWKKTAESQTLKLMEKISSLQIARTKDQEKIRQLSSKMAEFRIAQLYADIPKFRHDLAEFSKLVKNPHKEEDIQQFLEKNTWLFGAEYMETQPIYFSQFGFSNSRFDFLLQRYDTFFDIIEIKRADAPLLNLKESSSEDNIPSRKVPVSVDLKNVISQMIGYLELVNEKKNELRKKGVFIHKPKGKIIIGRALTTKEKRAIKTVGSYLNQIEIMTYDDLIERGNVFVEIIEKRRMTPN